MALRARPRASTSFSRVPLIKLLLVFVGGAVLGWVLRGLRKPAKLDIVVPQGAVAAPLEYVRAALEWCSRMSDAVRVILWELDSDDDLIFPISNVGAPRPAPQRLAGDPVAWAARENVSIRVDPPPTWSPAPRVYAVPVTARSGRSFVLTLELTDTVPVEPSKFDGLGLYVSAIMSLEDERSELAREHARADDLIATLRALPAALDTATLAHQLARAARDIVQGGGAALSIVEHGKGRVIAVDGDAPPLDTAFEASESESALAVRAGVTLVRDAKSIGSLPLVGAGERLARKPKAFAAVPLKVAGETIGVLSAWGSVAITQHAVADLETLAPYAALQLRQAHELGAMKTLAEHDTLTGLYNRHAFDEFFAAEAARHDRYQRPYSLIIFDLDHFKTVNDRYGHEAGDSILQQVSAVISGSLRSVDFAARLGGEEFVVVLPETGLEKAMEIAERVRARMAEHPRTWRGQQIEVKLSAGVAAIPESVDSPDALLRSADQALYRSKNEGRNRVTAAGVR